MLKLPKFIRGSLTGKLISVTVILIIISVGISWFLLIRVIQKNSIKNVINNSMSNNVLVLKGIHYSMLTKQRDAIQRTIEDIAKEENIEGIRIFDSMGKIHYSSDQKEIGKVVKKESSVCKGCHTDPNRPSETISHNKSWFIYNADGGRRLITVLPIHNEPSCYTADCHFHSPDKRVLGVLETEYSLYPVDRESTLLTIKTAIYAIAFIFISSLITYLVLKRFVLRPIQTLSEAMKRVKEGDLNHSVDIRTDDEMGLLGSIFNLMTRDLNEARKKVEEWTRTLEEEVKKKADELKSSQDRLIQSEKLASLGRFTSDIVHEIRNPLTAIGGFARRLSRIVNGVKEKEYTDIIIDEVNRLEKLLREVLTFSRDVRFHPTRQDIRNIIKEVVKLYEDLCIENGIDVEVILKEELPDVLVGRDQLREAIGNLISNAIDAMPSGGTLTITADTEKLHNVIYVVIKVSDTGCGIPEDKLNLIFEPFFSTKEVGVGTGLGLSITKKIMEEHGGFMSVKSVVGEGTTMSLYFPYQSIEESLKIKCWEYMKCGMDEDASVRCPAYPDFGRICWVIAGTFCARRVQGTFAQKYEDCRKCEFYQRVKNREI